MRRRRLHAVLALLLTLGTVLGSLTVPAATSHGAETEGSTSGTRPAVLGTGGSADADGLAVSVDDLSPRVLTDQSRVSISGTLTNTGKTTLESQTLTVLVQASTPVTQAQLTAFLSGQAFPGQRVATQTLRSSLAAGQSTHFSLDVPTADLPLSDAFTWGPRGVTVRADSGDSTGEDRTLLVWDSGYDVRPTQIGALVPWTSGEASGSEEEHAALLDLAGTPGVTLAVDPEALNDSAPSDPSTSPSPAPSVSPSTSPSASPSPSGDVSAQSGSATTSVFATELMSTASEIVALPAWDSDLGALALGKSDTLLDLALSTRDAFDSTVPTSTPEQESIPSSSSASPSTSTTSTPTPSSSASPAASATTTGTTTGTTTESTTREPSTSTGTGARATVVHDVVWPTEASFGLQVLDRFRNQVVIAPPGALAPSEDINFTSVTRVEVDRTSGQSSTQGHTDSTTTVLTSQEAISSLLAWDPTSAADTLDAEQVLTALGSMITRELPNQSRTLLALVPRGTPVDAGLVARLDALLDQRWVTGRSFSELASSDPTDVSRQQVGKAADLDASTSMAFSAIGDALTRITPLAEAVSDPRALRSRIESQALRMLSASSDAQERTASANELREQVDDLLSSVKAEPSVTINLVNKTASFPVRVTNHLPWAVKVRVTLDPSDPRLSVEHPTETTIPAGSTTAVEVPVSAIGSGNIRVGLVVATTSGTVLDDSHSVEVRMRAGWEDTLTKSVAALIALLFLFGIVRTVRRRRRVGAPGLSETVGEAPAGVEWVKVDEDGAGRPSPEDPHPGRGPAPDAGASPGRGVPTGSDGDTPGHDTTHEDRDDTTEESR